MPPLAIWKRAAAERFFAPGGSLAAMPTERGERSPARPARMLVRILARDPALAAAEAGLAERTRKRRGGETGREERSR